MNRAIFIAVASLLLILCSAIAEEYIEVQSEEYPYKESILKSVWDLNWKAGGFEHNGSYELALMCYNKSLELDPNYAPTWYSKGFVLKQMERYGEALDAFDQATKKNPLSTSSWHMKGDMLYGFGRYDEAIKAYDMVIDIDPSYVGAWYGKGDALKALGRNIEANETFTKAEEIRLKNLGY
jgi:tetratricopeptide (TPR) repeat protein